MDVIWFTEAQYLDLLDYILYSKLLLHLKKLTEGLNLQGYKRPLLVTTEARLSQQRASKMKKQHSPAPSHSALQCINAS